MTTRGKFRVNSIKTYDANGSSATVELSAVLDSSTPENERFAQATPFGKIEMTINNPPAQAEFLHGREFYVDFTPIDRPV